MTQPSSEDRRRFVVGMDLGTTNSAVCYVDCDQRPWRVSTLAIPQLVAAGEVESLESLPSFHYEPAQGEFPPESLQLPFDEEPVDHVVGTFAREQGALVPGRVIASAKSWLCHGGVDRTAPLLPWQGAVDVTRLSPVEVSARYLDHVRRAWDARFPGHPLAEQDFILTIPASFDEVARRLTIKAAARAGLNRVVLIEEPQAAFYAWIDHHRDDWDRYVSPGQKILVCDIGGGTSDFTLIRVRSDAGGRFQFHRVAVGEHLILGGDNLDLALARHIEGKLGGEQLPPRQWSALVGRCRRAKETLLAENAPEQLTLNIPSPGAKLIGGGVNVDLTRDEVTEVLLEGFFPRVPLHARPTAQRSGFQEFGLPYAADPAVTRYLAAFLAAHRHVTVGDEPLPEDHDPARPDVVLFNGGLFFSTAIRDRVLDRLSCWFSESAEQPWYPLVLQNDRLDLAVARGAAYYGMVRRGEGVRIAAGLARTYYLGVATAAHETTVSTDETESAAPGSPSHAATPASETAGAPSNQETAAPTALCVVPAGIEPGHEVRMEGRTFRLRVAEPVEFPLFYSSTRLTDRPAALVPFDPEQITALPPIRTVLKTQRRSDSGEVDVELFARLTEIGTLELWCGEAGGRRTWRLEFDVRSATQTDIAAQKTTGEASGVYDESVWNPAEEIIRQTFGPDGQGKPEGLMKRLRRALEMNRNDWPTTLLRRMWSLLMECEQGRRRSQNHEARWLNLLGYCLRPGYGLSADDWRVEETWRTLQGRLIHATPMCRAEWWILWRRIAGGLTAGQQQALAAPLMSSIRSLHRQITQGRGSGDFPFGTHETAEIWRLLGSFELVPVSWKIELGDMLLDMLPKRKMEATRPAACWALGRLGARVPVYGPLNCVIPPDTAESWLRQLTDSRFADPMLTLAVMQTARRCHDRYRDLPERLREKAVTWLRREGAPEHYLTLVQEGGTLQRDEQGMIFGEALPLGLRIL